MKKHTHTNSKSKAQQQKKVFKIELNLEVSMYENSNKFRMFQKRSLKYVGIL